MCSEWLGSGGASTSSPGAPKPSNAVRSGKAETCLNVHWQGSSRKKQYVVCQLSMLEQSARQSFCWCSCQCGCMLERLRSMDALQGLHTPHDLSDPDHEISVKCFVAIDTLRCMLDLCRDLQLCYLGIFGHADRTSSTKQDENDA